MQWFWKNNEKKDTNMAFDRIYNEGLLKLNEQESKKDEPHFQQKKKWKKRNQTKRYCELFRLQSTNFKMLFLQVWMKNASF